MKEAGKLLISEPPLIVLPSLAVGVGLNEAIFLQQLHFLLLGSSHEYEGRRWIYNSYGQWHKIFPFFKSKNTIIKIIKSLEAQGLILCRNFNKLKIDKTRWYSMDYEKVASIYQELVDQLPESGKPATKNWLTNTKDFLQRLSPEEKDSVSSIKNITPLSPGGATPHIPPLPQEGQPPLPQEEKSIEEVDKCISCTPEDVVGVWHKRLSIIPGMRGPSVVKRRQWAGEIEQWVKEDGGLTCQEILDVLIFAMESDFWRTVIASPKALKRNWDTLVGQKTSRNGTAEAEGIIEEFAQEYARARGKEYIMEGRDKFKARELLGQVAREEISELIKEFFGREDDFLDKQGRTFSCFAGQVNRLRGKKQAEKMNETLQKNLEIIRAEKAKATGPR